MPKRVPPILQQPDGPEALWLRFRALCYRTTRAILRARRLLGEGQPLAAAATQTKHLLRQTFPFDVSDPLLGTAASFLEAENRPPTAPFPDLDHLTPAVSDLHTQAAIEIGVDPEDEVLFWLGKDQILAVFPPLQELIALEAEAIEVSSRFLTAKSRSAALQALERIFGKLHHLERPDFGRLPYAPLVDYASTTPEEDRALMVARLERLAARAREALDIRTEAAVLRSIAQIQGLTYQDVDNEQRNMRQLFANPVETFTEPELPKIVQRSAFLVEDTDQ